MSLIPTTTGSATAIGLIFPELQGKLDGLAVRVPLLNASLTDCVFEVARADHGRGGQRAAARPPPTGRSPGILGYEERPLVSIDYKDDPRSGIVDALSTMVTDGTQVKILAWYDNEWGYANRLVELAAHGRREPRLSAVSDAAAHAATATCATTCSSPRAYWADTIADGAIRHARPLLLLRARLHAVPARDALRLLRDLRHRHEPRRRLPRGAVRPQDDAASWASSIQIVALLMLGARARRRGSSSAYVMAAQALSGIAKDLTKMSSKSAVKLVVADDAPGALYRWVAILTGSKNALKGVGFFLGGLLLTVTSFQTAMLLLAAMVLRRARARPCRSCTAASGAPTRKAKFRHMFSNNRAVNVLAAARDLPLRLARRLVRRRPARSSCAPCSAGASGRSARSWRSG